MEIDKDSGAGRHGIYLLHESSKIHLYMEQFLLKLGSGRKTPIQSRSVRKIHM